MSPLVTILIACAAAIPAAVGAVFVAARRFSGKIKSSEAVTLWAAQENFRTDLMKRNDKLRERLDQCEKLLSLSNKRLDELEEINAELRIENGELKAKITQYDELISALREQLEEKDKEIAALQGRVKELEDHNG